MNRRISVVTTFNQSGYDIYGRRMISSFLQNWPQAVMLCVYPERCTVDVPADRIQVYPLEQVQALHDFKTKWGHVPKANGDVTDDPVRSRRKDAGKGFKWDAVRFAHKVYAIFDCVQRVDTDILIWMDADTVCHSAITIDDLYRMIPTNKDLCFLGRRGKFSECGLYAMDLTSPRTRHFLSEFQRVYDHAEQGIFTMEEWHDSFVFDQVRRGCVLQEHDWCSHLIAGEGHPLINSDWGAWLDHLKGQRKHQGRSLDKDLRVHRTEAYWLNRS
jgi:hypothetical protein